MKGENMEKFVVKKSAWKVVNFWSIVLCILIIPIIVLVGIGILLNIKREIKGYF